MHNEYLSTFIDYSFYRVFGGPSGKPLLIDFLNSVLPPESQIKELRYENPTQSKKQEGDRTLTMDVYCENEKGEEFTVEILNAWANFYGDRDNFYSYFPAWRQALKNELPDFPSQKIFCIGILNFAFDLFEKEYEWDEYRHVIKHKDWDGRLLSRKLTCIYLEVPNFSKLETELVSRLDKWLYFIKHLDDFQKIPLILKNDEIFKKAFEKADTTKFTHDEFEAWKGEMKLYWDRYEDLEPKIKENKGRARTEERAIAAQIRYEEVCREARKIAIAQSERWLAEEKKKEQKRVAGLLLKNGFSLPDIAKGMDFLMEELSDLLSDDAKRGRA